MTRKGSRIIALFTKMHPQQEWITDIQMKRQTVAIMLSTAKIVRVAMKSWLMARSSLLTLAMKMNRQSASMKILQTWSVMMRSHIQPRVSSESCRRQIRASIETILPLERNFKTGPVTNIDIKLQETRTLVAARPVTHTFQTCTRRKNSLQPPTRIIAWTRARTSWGTRPSLKQSSTTWNRNSAKMNSKLKSDWIKIMYKLNRMKFYKKRPPVKSSRRLRKRFTTQQESHLILRPVNCSPVRILFMEAKLRFRT